MPTIGSTLPPRGLPLDIEDCAEAAEVFSVADEQIESGGGYQEQPFRATVQGAEGAILESVMRDGILDPSEKRALMALSEDDQRTPYLASGGLQPVSLELFAKMPDAVRDLFWTARQGGRRLDLALSRELIALVTKDGSLTPENAQAVRDFCTAWIHLNDGKRRLGETGAVRTIESGRVELYALVDGQRHFLAELGAGAWLFGHGGPACPIIASSPDGAWLSWPEGAPVAPTLLAKLETWITALSEGVTRYASSRPATTGGLPGDQIRIASQAAVSAAHGVTWIRGRGDTTLRFLGDIPVPPGTPFPATPATWLIPDEDDEIVGLSTADVVGALGLPALLVAFDAALAAAIAVGRERERIVQRCRLESLEDQTAREMERTYTSFAAVLDSKPARDEAADDLTFVLRAIGAIDAPPTNAEAQAPAPVPVDGGTGIGLMERLEECNLLPRRVSLEGRWWSRDKGPMIGLRREDGRVVALVPDWLGRYKATLRGAPPVRITAEIAATLAESAFTVQRALPNRAITVKELTNIFLALVRADVLTLLVASMAVSLLGLVMPVAMGQMIDTFIPDRLRGAVAVLGGALLVLTLSRTLMTTATDIARQRIDGRLSPSLKAATMDRILRLPMTKLRSQSAAQLSFQIMAVDQAYRLVTRTVLATGLSGLFGLSGIIVLLLNSSTAAMLAGFMFLALMGLAALAGMRQISALAQGEKLETNVLSFTLELIQNIGVIRAFGAQRRAYAVWARDSANMRRRTLRARKVSMMFDALLNSYDTVALAAIFAVLGWAEGGGLSTGSYMAFVVAYQGFLMASNGLARCIAQVVASKPILQQAVTVFRSEPETPPLARPPGKLSGLVDVANVTFAYGPGQPTVLNGVSLRIEPGKFVALVGPSGCGKSTLISLLLGMDRPQSGTVLYDGHDLAHLSLPLLRRQIGVVRQAGKLMVGSLYENIVGLHEASLEEAWHAAEFAGVADDIHALPMGMHTVLNEGASTFSSGQVQRLLIARALVGRPRILILDEATSALDNVTQAKVTDTINRLGITRIVIAHRLSTIMQADVIHLIEDGRVSESGRAQDLIAAGGRFASFVHRQAL